MTRTEYVLETQICLSHCLYRIVTSELRQASSTNAIYPSSETGCREYSMVNPSPRWSQSGLLHSDGLLTPGSSWECLQAYSFTSAIVGLQRISLLPWKLHHPPPPSSQHKIYINHVAYTPSNAPNVTVVSMKTYHIDGNKSPSFPRFRIRIQGRKKNSWRGHQRRTVRGLHCNN